MKKLILSILVLFAVAGIFSADARLVSGVSSHKHDSASGGGDSLSTNTKIAPSIFVYDENAPTNEKYWKFGNASGDFVLFTYDDAQGLGQTAFTITRTGTTTDLLTITPPTTIEGKLTTGTLTTGTLTTSGTLTSTRPCDTGYTRIDLNFCLRDAPTWVALVRDTCTVLGPASTNSKAVLLRFMVFANSANAIGERWSFINSYTTNTCDTLLVDQAAHSRGYEHSAIAAGIALGSDTGTVVMRSPDGGTGTGGQHYVKFTDDTGNNGTAYYMFFGYYD